jgi:hypothetical protein
MMSGGVVSSSRNVNAKIFRFPADHLNQVGWWDPGEAINAILAFESIFKQATEYEGSIKNLYLEIAQNLH